MLRSQERYEGIQTVFKRLNVGEYGCYLLSLCSVAEDATDKNVDFLDVLKVGYAKGWIEEECFIRNPLAILEYLTGSKWNLRVVEKMPDVVKDNEYTIVKWKWRGTHFRRRPYDSIVDSNTCKYGKIKEVYVFEKIP